MRAGGLSLALGLVLSCGPAVAQSPPPPAPPAWAFSAEAYLYLQESGDNFVPMVRADHGSLHLEARYQYEGKKTFSAWAGWTFSTGTSLTLEATPLVGGLVGNTRGVAAGLEFTLAWKTLELYGESEYVLDLEGKDGDFFYNWMELGWHATPWLTAGLATQRTRLYQSDRALDWGVFAGVKSGRVGFKVYGFGLDTGGRLGVLALTVDL